ncbi:MAG: FAD-dependent monooxygenase [Gammaproteobacteria bacterium]|nr:FAD-dependent monooxygenase [Gammaproteobacteria bacterium]
MVGASIAGPALCYWLKKFGFSPTLIEKNTQLRQGGFPIDVHGIAVDVVKKMGIYQKIVDKRRQLKSQCYIDVNGNTLSKSENEAVGFYQGDEIEILRGNLAEILMQRISEIPCYFNQTVDNIVQHAESVEVIFKDGAVEHFDFVIGADGVHSSVRKIVFTPEEYDLFDLGSYISVFSVPNFLNLDHGEMIFERHQKLIHVSSDKNPNTAVAGFMFRSDEKLNDARDEKEQKYFLKKTLRDLGWKTNELLHAMKNCDDFYFDSIVQVKMKSWTKGRVALVGDAGYCPSPLSGQGTSLALVGAYILAGELKAASGELCCCICTLQHLIAPLSRCQSKLWIMGQ